MKKTTSNNRTLGNIFVYHFLLIIMMMLAMPGLVACGEKDDDTKEPDTPETPVNPSNPSTPGNGTKVPVAGGTVAQGDIALTFASGTFAEDTEVALKEVSKGESYGEYEASKFYELTLPAKVDRPVEVKIKSTVENGTLLGVMIESGLRKSLAEDASLPVYLEGTYDAGEFTFSIPATQNAKDDGQSTVTIGLINVEDAEDGTTRAGTVKPASNFLVIQGKVGNIEWYYDMYTLECLMLNSANKKKLKSNFDKINKYITYALTQIHSLGFQVETSRRIPFIFTTLELSKDHFGAFVQSPSDDKKSCVELHLTKVLTNESDASLSQTIIHELLHYFQADYDPRTPKKKCGGAEENVICEAASVWAEQFMNNGKLNGDFIEQYLPSFVRSMDDVDAITPNDVNALLHPIEWRNKEISRYGEHGYAMSTLLYYLTNPMSEMEAFDISKTSIVEIFKQWKKNKSYVGLTFRPFNKWFDEHECGFLMTDDFDNYILALMQGKIIDSKNINMERLGGGTKPILHLASLNETDKAEFADVCLSHGCRMARLSIAQRESFAGKKIVVKQMEPNVNTYVFVRDNSQNLELIDGRASQDNPLVISGEAFDKMLGGAKKSSIYLVIINHQSSKASYSTSCEIQEDGVKVSPDALTYSADGGEQSTFISNYEGYGYYGASVRSEGKGWCGVATTSTIGEIKINVLPNETSKERECIVDCYVYANSSTPESEWVKMPVKVKQAAGSGNTGVENISNFLRVELDATVMTNVLFDGKPYEKAYLREKRGAYLKYNAYDSGYDSSKWNVSGYITNGTVHVRITGVNSPVTFACDIEDFSGGDGTCRVSNIEYKYGSETSGDYVNFKAHGVPGESHKAGATRVYFWMEGTEADGISIDEYVERDLISTYDGRYYEHSYKSDSANKITLIVDFMRDASGSSRSASLPSAPWKASAPAGLNTCVKSPL